MTVVATLGVAENLLVHEPLDFFDFGAVHGGVMSEVETQAAGIHHAAGLLDVRAQHLAQRGVEQVSRGVIAAGGVAQRRGHFGAQHVADAMGAWVTMRWTIRPGTPGKAVSTSATLSPAPR